MGPERNFKVDLKELGTGRKIEQRLLQFVSYDLRKSKSVSYGALHRECAKLCGSLGSRGSFSW